MMSLLNLLRSEFFEDWVETMRSWKLKVLLEVLLADNIHFLRVGTVIACRLRTNLAKVPSHLWLGLLQTEI